MLTQNSMSSMLCNFLWNIHLRWTLNMSVRSEGVIFNTIIALLPLRVFVL